MEVNQCDGCRRGLAVKDKIHIEKDGMPYIGCSSSLYEKSDRPSCKTAVAFHCEAYESLANEIFELGLKTEYGCAPQLGEIYEILDKYLSADPSDLEIVQKALEETGFELEYFSSGNWWIHSTGTIGQVVRTGTGSQSLLTWSKKTINQGNNT